MINVPSLFLLLPRHFKIVKPVFEDVPLSHRHVVIETNKTTARLFPEVPDCETPEFWDHMEKLIVLNKKLIAVGASDAPGWLKTLQKVHPLLQVLGLRLHLVPFAPLPRRQ